MAASRSMTSFGVALQQVVSDPGSCVERAAGLVSVEAGGCGGGM
jgi:hypothetical protein